MKPHILLIEDNDDIRENTAEILELANYQVSTAPNGKTGVEMALANPPQLIICDIMMPVLDGYGVLQLINKNPSLSGIPFIFLTAKAERGDLRKGMEMGADDYISKPFTDGELLAAVESRLRKTLLLQKNYPNDDKGMQEVLEEFQGAHALEDLVKNRPEKQYRKKEIVYNIGQHPQKLFYIKEGKVKTFVSNEDGKDLTVGLHTAGDFLGYTALLESGRYKDTAEAIDHCVIAEIPVESFEKVLHHNVEATRKIIQLLARNIVEKEKQLLGIAYNSLRKRVATALISLKQKYKKPDEEDFSIQLSREDLANIAGTATESLIRTLSDFKSEKLIDIKGSRISLLNEKKLESLIN
ncbi:MAG: response regulator [Chitinophagaceae bacterium]|nr:MAG: response regulator [Chitinophagaceae bacterium]